MADMVPDEVQAAERGHRIRDDAVGELNIPQVAGDADRAPARAGDLLDNLVDTRLVDVHQPDGGALPREADGPCLPHAGGRRRHDPDLPLESHLRSFLQSSVRRGAACI
jgi:hypothetical protein